MLSCPVGGEEIVLDISPFYHLVDLPQAIKPSLLRKIMDDREKPETPRRAGKAPRDLGESRRQCAILADT